MDRKKTRKVLIERSQKRSVSREELEKLRRYGINGMT